MNKSEFLTCLSGKLPYDKDGIDFLFQIIYDVLKDGLKHDKQVKTPIGTFKVVKRKPHKIRNIHTKQVEILPEKYVIKFTPESSLEKLISEEIDE
jgi:nucleoid DNA-binding protein